MFAELQQKALATDLKHVEKNAHKKDPALAGEPVVPKKPVAKPAEKKEEVKRAPKKELNNNQWFVENFGKEVIKFEGDDV